MKKIIYSIAVFVSALLFGFVQPISLMAQDAPVVCPAQTQVYVSDATTLDTSDTHASVPLTFIHPNWTASITGASWVWSDNPVTDPTTDTTKVFTKTFTIAGTPSDSTLEIATDNTYTVSLNGHPILHSDTNGDNFSSANQDTIAVPASELVTGANYITFTVTNTGVPASTAEANPAGLLYKLTVNQTVCPTTGTIELKNVILPHSTNTYWNLGIDASYTFWDTHKVDGYDSGEIEVPAGVHNVNIQTAPGTDGLQYTTAVECTDGDTVLATSTPVSLIYDANVVAGFTLVAGHHVICTFTSNALHPDTSTLPASIEIKTITNPHDDRLWNFGMDSNNTLFVERKGDGYTTGPVQVEAGSHNVLEQVGYNPDGFTNGLLYSSQAVCMDGATVLATSSPVSLPYGLNLVLGLQVTAGHQVVCTFTNSLISALPTDLSSLFPLMPLLLSPADGIVIKPLGLMLDWSDVVATSTPVTYYYESSLSPATTTDNAFASVIYGPVALPVSQIDASGSADNVYYWKARACDSTAVCSSWSDAWKLVVDSQAPVSTFSSPNPDTEFNTPFITLSGTTTDANVVASTTLAYALYIPATPTVSSTCSAYTDIVSLVNPTPTSTFAWTYDWSPADGTYCIKSHGEDIAGNREMSPVVMNVKYSKPVTVATTTTTGGGGTSGGSTGGSGGGAGGSTGGGGGGNGPVVGSLGGGTGSGNSTGGTSNTGGTSGTSTPPTTPKTATSTTGQLAALYSNVALQSTGANPGYEEDETATSSSDIATTAPETTHTDQTASVINGGAGLTWKTGLWIFLLLLILILLIVFFSRRKKDNTIKR